MLPVQIVKEGRGDKKHGVSKKLSLFGRYCAVLYAGKPSGKLLFSGRLQPEEKNKLRESFLATFGESNLSPRYDVLLRTNAARVDFSEVVGEIKKLSDKMDSILLVQDKRTDYSLLYEPPAELIRELYRIDLNAPLEITTDLPEEYERIKKEFLEGLPEELKNRVSITLYQDELLSLFHFEGLEAEIKRALDRRVWLKSGGSIVIEQTEALVSIDVNTARIDKKKEKEDTILFVNLEAAREAARQIRLRNLSGIIIIDFINMDRKEDEERLIRELRLAIEKDSVKTSFIELTKLGLAELTRKREGSTLSEMIREACPEEK